MKAQTETLPDLMYQAIIDMEDKKEFPKGLYIKVKITDDDLDCPAVEIVSTHKSWLGN